LGEGGEGEEERKKKKEKREKKEGGGKVEGWVRWGIETLGVFLGKRCASAIAGTTWQVNGESPPIKIPRLTVGETNPAHD
jgi:hypothetical protein